VWSAAINTNSDTKIAMKPTVSLFHVHIGLHKKQDMPKQSHILTVFEILGQGGLLQMLCFRWKGRLKIS